MTDALTVRRDHLGTHRRMIVGRSIAASLAALIPVPVFDDWINATIKRGTMKRIAADHGVDLDPAALSAIADGKSSAPSWTDIAGGALAYRILSRSARKILWLWIVTRRTQAAARNFLVATLFDHYCARLHVGLGLDAAAAAELRAAIDAALDSTPGKLSDRIFRKALVAAARGSVKAPLQLADIASGGALTRWRDRRRGEVEAIAEVDDAVDIEVRAPDSFLGRAASAAEAQLAAETNPYVESLVRAFEDLWRNRRRAPWG
jgi:hypothetical protein